MHTEKLPSGNYRVRAYAGKDRHGKAIRKSFTGKDKSVLLAEAAIWENEHRGARASGSFSREAEAYLTRCAPVLSPSTMRGYETIYKVLNRFPELAQSPLHSIDSKLLQGVVGQMTCSPKTIQNRLGFISAVLKANGLRLPPVKTPQVPKPVLNIPEPEVVRQTLEAASPEMWVVLMLAATGPLRQGEISALRMEDIDFERNVIHVHRNVALGPDEEYHGKPPKTDAGDRYISMPPELIARIKEQGYVTKWTPTQIQNKFRWLLKKHNIPYYRFHDLRHYCISELLAQKIGEIYVAERSGHSDHASLRIYTHRLQHMHEEIKDKVEAAWVQTWAQH